MKQRDLMRHLYARFAGNKAQCVRAYAQAERQGQVPRKSNNHNISPEAYAAALFDDGARKGWIR